MKGVMIFCFVCFVLFCFDCVSMIGKRGDQVWLEAVTISDKLSDGLNVVVGVNGDLKALVCWRSKRKGRLKEGVMKSRDQCDENR